MPSQHRIALHRIPELDCHLPETAAYVRGVLSGLHCRVLSLIHIYPRGDHRRGEGGAQPQLYQASAAGL